MKHQTGPFSDFFYLSQMIGYLKSEALIQSKEFEMLGPVLKYATQLDTSPDLELLSVSNSAHEGRLSAVFQVMSFRRLPHTVTSSSNLFIQHAASPLISAPKNYIAFATAFINLQSCGSISLRSKDALDPPFVDPSFLHEDFDKHMAIKVVRTAMAFLGTPALAKNHLRFAAEPESKSDEDILIAASSTDVRGRLTNVSPAQAFVQKTAISMWHTCVTVAMGKPDLPETCVDTNFQVAGLQGL
ncbi:MAG: hypothetical protein Q9170_002436 [Blastenia crenularia]